MKSARSQLHRARRALTLVSTATRALALPLVELLVAHGEFSSTAHDIWRQIVKRG